MGIQVQKRDGNLGKRHRKSRVGIKSGKGVRFSHLILQGNSRHRVRLGLLRLI